MISILLGTHNGAEYLSLAIESILNQSFTDFELLIGFNGTTDSSKNIPSKYTDNRIRVFDYGEDMGRSKTLNKLLLESKFNLIAIQDDDDMWIQDKLLKQIEFMNYFDIVGCFCSYINESGHIIGGPRIEMSPSLIKKLSLSGNNQIINSGSICKKIDIENIGAWRSEVDGIEDYDLRLRLFRIGKTAFNYPEVLVHHRLHPKSHFNTKSFNLAEIL